MGKLVYLLEENQNVFVFSKSFWPIIVWQLFYFGCKKGIFFARDWAVFWRVVLKKGICTFQVHKLVLFKYLRPNWITIHFFFHYYSIFLWYQKRAGLLNDDDFFFKSFFISYFHNCFFQWQWWVFSGCWKFI